MTLPNAPISLSNLNTELQRPANYANVNLNEFEIRRIAGIPSQIKQNPVSLNDCRNKTWQFYAGNITMGLNSAGGWTGYQWLNTGSAPNISIPTPYGDPYLAEWLTVNGTNEMKITIGGVNSQDMFNYLNYLINACYTFSSFANLNWVWDSKNSLANISPTLNYGQGFVNGGVYSCGLYPGNIGA